MRGFEQVRRHGRDPFAYLEWVFGKLMLKPGPQEMEVLLPAEWLKHHAAATPVVEVAAEAVP